MKCGMCQADLGQNLIGPAVAVHTPSGNVIVGDERPIHKCATVTKEDEMAALKSAGAALPRPGVTNDQKGLANMTGEHRVRPYPAENGRVRCLYCESSVVGTPAGWFHVTDTFGSSADIASDQPQRQ